MLQDQSTLDDAEIFPPLLSFGADVGFGSFVYELLQDGFVDVGEAFDVEAATSGFVFPEAIEQVLVVFESGQQVDGEVLFARGYADAKPVAFASACVAIVVSPVADNSVSPHGWFFA